MKTRYTLLATAAIAMLLVVGFVGAGWWLLARSPWGGVAWASAPMGGSLWGWCGGGSGRGALGGPRALAVSAAAEPITIQEARSAVQRLAADLDGRDLKVGEVIEFERNFYAIVEERDTGVGAMELLVDKRTGGVGPEYGPNMMWNARYGMHRGGMMGAGTSGKMTVSPEEAQEIAQRWLDAYRPGSTVEPEVDAFYGYYTLHTLRDGQIDGMLSVHGNTGQVWYHNWHGAFIQMIEAEDD